MTNRLEELKREYYEKFGDDFMEVLRLADKGKDHAYGKAQAKLQIDIGKFITHIYSKAIEDCRHALPEFKDINEPSVGLDTGWKAKGWNACTSQADENLEALLPQQ